MADHGDFIQPLLYRQILANQAALLAGGGIDVKYGLAIGLGRLGTQANGGQILLLQHHGLCRIDVAQCRRRLARLNRRQ